MNSDLMVLIEGLSKSFGRNHVLRGVDLEVRRGESMVVIGGSGSGKSVLLKHIVGLLKPESGSVVVAGCEVPELDEHGLNELRIRIGMLFQGAALFDSLSVWENVGFALKQHTRHDDAEIRRIASEKLKMVGLSGIGDLMPSELSGGMKKRVGLARAIAIEPEIMLYDEPTTGLDPIMADVINDLILSLQRELHVTSISITHDMTSAYKIADRIAMLYQGRIIEVGTPEEIRNTSNQIVRQFISGSSRGPIPLEVTRA